LIDEILHFVQDDSVVFLDWGGKQGRFAEIFVTCQILFETPLLPSLMYLKIPCHSESRESG